MLQCHLMLVKKKKKLIDRSMVDARTKAYREHRARLEARR